MTAVPNGQVAGLFLKSVESSALVAVTIVRSAAGGGTARAGVPRAGVPRATTTQASPTVAADNAHDQRSGAVVRA
jgi:hypothetical protein